MYRRAIALSAGLCLFAGTVWSEELSVFTANQLVDAAIHHNREFQSVQERVKEAQALRRQADVGVPDSLQVSAVGGQVVRNAGEDNVSLAYSHTFETFGKRRLRVQAADQEVAIAEAELDDQRRNLAFEVKMRFADAAVEQLKLAAIDRQFEVNREYLRLTEARVQKGDAAPLEASLLRVDLNREQAERLSTQGRARGALLELAQIAAADPSGLLRIDNSLTPPVFSQDLARLKADALAFRPDLRSQRRGEGQAAKQVQLARAETKPNITLAGQYTHADSAFDQYGFAANGVRTPIRDHDDMLGLGFSIPLTTSKRNRGNIEASSARQTAVRLRREHFQAVIPAQVEAAFGRWTAAKQAAELYDSGVVQQSERNLSVMRQAYSLGELRSLDILHEQRRLLDTELEFISAQGDLFRAYVELEHAVGGFLR